MLPPDNHVHTEWSWDAPAEASMVRSCEQALAAGVPAVAFTDHLDFTAGTDGDQITAEHIDPRPYARMHVLDVPGYLAAVQECRQRYPDLRILTGAEIGEAHLWAASAQAVVAGAGFDRILGSLHAIPFDGKLTAADDLFRRMPADEVMRLYFAELLRLVEGSDIFQVLAHLDFPRRMWPRAATPYDERAFEPEIRAVLQRPGRRRADPRGEHEEPAGVARVAEVVAGGRGNRGVVRERRAPALAGRRPVQAGGRRGRGGRLPRRAGPVRLLAVVVRLLAVVEGDGRRLAGLGRIPGVDGGADARAPEEGSGPPPTALRSRCRRSG